MLPLQVEKVALMGIKSHIESGKYSVVVANGEFPQSGRLRQLIGDAEIVISGDGATMALEEYGREPDFIVGDMDSLPTDIAKRYGNKVIHVTDQETNDLTKCVRHAFSLGIENLYIVGATGKREDHTLGNISLLTAYRGMFKQLRMVSDYGTFIAIRDTTTFEAEKGCQVSIIALPPVARMTFHGLKYPIKEYAPLIWWEATLNEVLESEFTIELHDKGDVLIYISNERK